MDEKTKQILVAVLAVVAVGVAIAVGVNAMTPAEDKVEIVGELPMPEGGGRDSEAGPVSPNAQGGQPATADAASGMPAEMAGPSGR